jgi:hypothetical protein
MSLDAAFAEAVKAIAFEYPHPLFSFGTWRLQLRGPWSLNEPRFNWWAFAEPYNATGRGLDRAIEGYGETLEEALVDLVAKIREIA